MYSYIIYQQEILFLINNVLVHYIPANWSYRQSPTKAIIVYWTLDNYAVILRMFLEYNNFRLVCWAKLSIFNLLVVLLNIPHKPVDFYLIFCILAGLGVPQLFALMLKRWRAVFHPLTRNALQLGAVHKGRPQSGRSGDLSSADKGGKGSSDADVRTFWRKNRRIFRNLWCVRTGEGVRPVRTFFGQGGRGSIFRDFVQTSFLNGFLL